MTKICTKCGIEKPLEAFRKQKNGKFGHGASCKDCEKIQKHLWYEENREARLAYSVKYREEHPEWFEKMNANRDKSYDWRKKYPEKAKELQVNQSRRRRFRNHGITPEIYDNMLLDQNGLCASCGEVPTTSSVRPSANKYDDFVIDHDHVTGNIRGLICTNCNVALGMIRDNPEHARKLALYLERNSLLNCGLEVQKQEDVSRLSSEAEHLNLIFKKEINPYGSYN